MFMELRKWASYIERSSVQRGIFALSDQSVVSINNFILAIILGRSCTKEEFGLYILAFSLVLFVMDAQGSLILTPYMIYSPRLEGQRHRQYRGSIFIHQLIFSFIVMLLLGISILISSHGIGPQGLARVFKALFFVIPFIMVSDNIRRMCFANLRMKTALFFDCLVAVIQISGLIFLSYLGTLSASNAIWAIGISTCISSIVWLTLNRKIFVFQTNHVLRDFKNNWVLGKWLLVSGLLGSISLYIYPWFLAFLHGTKYTGTWAACVGSLGLANPVFLGLQNFFAPRIMFSYAEKNKKRLKCELQKTIFTFSALLAPIALAFIIFGNKIVVLFYGNKYIGTNFIMSLLAINMILSSVGFSISRAILAMERSDLDLIINFIGVLFLFTFGLWLVRILNVLGAGYGLLVVTSLIFSLRLIVFKRLSINSQK